MTANQELITRTADILVVDDTIASLRMLTEILTKAGYKTRPVEDSHLALEAALAQPPSLILLDVKMPKMSGFELCRRLKQDERTREVPVIFVSALEDTEDKVQGFEAGGVDFVSKPFQAAEVLARVKTHLQLRVMQLYLEALVAERTTELQETNEALGEEIGERKIAQLALGESEKKYRAVVEGAVEGILVMQGGQRKYCNPAWLKMTGYSAEEYESLSFLSLVHPGDLETVRGASQNLAVEQVFNSLPDLRIITKSGDVKWVSVRGSIIDWDSEPARMVFIDDITEQKRAGDQLRFQAHLLDAVEQAVIVTDLEGRIVYWNPFAERLYGWSAEEAMGRTTIELIASEQARQYGAEIMARLQAGESWAGEYLARRRDGTHLYIQTTATPIYDAHGELYNIIGISSDITKRKQAEEALRQSEARFRATFEQAAVGIAHVAPDGSFLRLNRKFFDTLGYSHDEMLARTFQDITHPDDLDTDLEYKRQLLAGEIETYNMEKRYLRKSGEFVWVNLTVSLVRKETGEPDYSVSVVEDITRRKQAEQTLRESEEQYRTLELEPLLELILDHLSRVVEYDGAAIWLRERDKLVIRAGRTPEGVPSSVGRRISTAAGATISEMIETREPVIVADTANYKDLAQELVAIFEPLSQYYERAGTSWLGVPVVTKNQLIGIVSLVSDQPGHYTHTRADSVQTLVNRAAIAIENARLHEQVQQTAILEERTRLARELHDAVTQTLFSASLLADTTPRIWEKDQTVARQNLNQLGRLLRGALAEMRTLLFELRPATVENQSLGQLLGPLAEAAYARSRAKVSLNVEGDQTLPEDVTRALLRIAQESLNNVAKHAEATEVQVNLNCGPKEVVLGVTDDGRGFDLETIPAGHYGLSIMRERASEIRAILKVESKPGGGTQVVVTWSEQREEHGND